MYMIEDKMYKLEDYFGKSCKKHITYKNWYRHLRNPKHLRNNTDTIIRPKFRRKA